MTQRKILGRETVSELLLEVGVWWPEPGLSSHPGALAWGSALHHSGPAASYRFRSRVPPSPIPQGQGLRGCWWCCPLSDYPWGSSAATWPALTPIQVSCPLLFWPRFCHSSEDCTKTHSFLKVPGFSPCPEQLTCSQGSLAPARRSHLSNCRFLQRGWKARAERNCFLLAAHLCLNSLDFPRTANGKWMN